MKLWQLQDAYVIAVIVATVCLIPQSNATLPTFKSQATKVVQTGE